MADFLCPKCGSIDHLEGRAVLYPRQCPGCDEFVDRASAEVSGPQANVQTKRPAVRIELLRTDAWATVKRRRATLAKAKIWGAAALTFAVVSGGLYAWLAWPGPVAIIDRGGVNAAASARPETEPDSPKPVQARDRNSANIAPAVDRDRALAQVDADPASGRKTAGPAASDPATSDPATSDPAISPRDSASSESPANGITKSDDLESATADRLAESPYRPPVSGSRIGLATPLYGRVPMLSRPSWSGKEIQELSSVDMLLVLDAKPLHSWLHVMEIHSGAQGWVHESQVRLGKGSE